MNKEFVPYEQALALKELGFDEPSFGLYAPPSKTVFLHHYGLLSAKEQILAPLYQQAFKWFRDKHDLVAAILPFQDIEDRVSLCYYYSIVDLDECKDEDILCNESSLGASDINFSSHPEAELACLVKLIDIIENK
jgi:hypothetical protein